jgi:hypothetical protein
MTKYKKRSYNTLTWATQQTQRQYMLRCRKSATKPGPRGERHPSDPQEAWKPAT